MKPLTITAGTRALFDALPRGRWFGYDDVRVAASAARLTMAATGQRLSILRRNRLVESRRVPGCGALSGDCWEWRVHLRPSGGERGE